MLPIKKQHRELLVLGMLSLLMFTLLLISSMVKPYGFFIDELYFMACANRPAWGYIDQPPLSIVLLTVVQHFFGSSMLAVRLLPALSIAGTVFVTGLIARQIGGSLASMMLSALAVMIMPVFLLFGSFYSMNAYEPLIFTAIVFFAVKMLQEDNPRYWLVIGMLFGVGLEMKHTIVLYGLALVLGFLLSAKRKLLWSPWVIWGGLSCFLIILPNLIWQYVNHFPTLELYHNSFVYKNIEKPPLQVILEQVIFVNPATFLLWFTGFIALFFAGRKIYRPLLYAYIFLMLVIVIGHSSRPDRISSIYPFFMAMGAVTIETYLKKAQRAFQFSLAVVMLAGGIIMAPLFIPLLPPDLFKTYASRLGVQFDIEAGKKDEPIPQWLADRIGWPELAFEVSKVYFSLPLKEQQNTVIVSSNYGEAGALELYGPQLGLPAVYGTHNSYHSWGPPPDSVRTYIGVFINADDVKEMFDSITEAAVFQCKDCTKPQQTIPVYILRGPRFSIKKEWPKFKIYG